MKKYLASLLFALFCCLPASAQIGNLTMKVGLGAPSGACPNNLTQYTDITNKNVYGCASATWFLIGGGGSASPLTTKGDIWGFSTVNARIPVGANTFVLTADSTQALGVKWAAPAAASVTFDQIGSGTNTTAAMVCDTGCSIEPANGGIIGLPITGATQRLDDGGGEVDVSNVGSPPGTGDGVVVAGRLFLNGASLTANNALITGAQFEVQNSCLINGTSANPSIVACGAASAGSISCAVASSTGTCTINTTAVGAGSIIIVQPSSAEGAALAVTCNTAPTLVPTVLLKSRTTGSFTLNMPTITTNPECFVFLVLGG